MLDYTIIATCPMCGKNQSVGVNKADYIKYRQGGDILGCFPYLSADDREAIMTGICPKCWDSMGGDED